MLSDLTDGDFSFYKRYSDAMRNCHESEFKKRIDPDLMCAMYRGKKNKEDESTVARHGYYDESKHVLALSRLFSATNTLVPNLYYRDPSPIVQPRRDSDENQAALMSAILKYYMKLNNAKRNNQEAVLNAWFFGIGWKKVGYRTVFMPKLDEPESKLEPSAISKIGKFMGNMFGMSEPGSKPPDNTESRPVPDLVDYETLYNDAESPMNIMVDHKADLMNSRAILHRLPRTLYDIQNFGNYENIDELVKYYQNRTSSRLDNREIDLTLNELHVKQRNGIWILSWVDDFPKPLRYDKSSADGKDFMFSPLVFTNEPGIRYPVSHMKVACQVQSKLDDLASMYVETVARSRRMLGINTKALSPGQEDVLEQNLIHGILKFNRDITPGVLAQIASTPVSNDVLQLMSLIQANVTEITGADQQLVSGKSTNETLGQDELARIGVQTRQSGMTDRVHDWMVDQLRKEGQLIKQFSNAELHLTITGKDYSDPQTGQKQEDIWAEFMTEANPLGAKQYLQGEFEYDVDIEEAIQPNKGNQRAQLMEMLQVVSLPQVQEMLLQGQARVRGDILVKKLIETFDAVGNPEMFVEQLTSQQVAAIQTQQVLKQAAGGLIGQANQKGQAPQGSKSPKPSGNGGSSKPKAQTEMGVSAPSSEMANQ